MTSIWIKRHYDFNLNSFWMKFWHDVEDVCANTVFVPLPVFFVSSGVTRVLVPKKLFRNDSLADNPRRKQKGKVGGVKWCLHIRSVYHVKISWINTQNWAWEPRRTGLGGVIPRQLRYSSGWTCVHRRLVRDTAGKNRIPHYNTAQHNAVQYSTVQCALLYGAVLVVCCIVHRRDLRIWKSCQTHCLK